MHKQNYILQTVAKNIHNWLSQAKVKKVQLYLCISKWISYIFFSLYNRAVKMNGDCQKRIKYSTNEVNPLKLRRIMGEGGNSNFSGGKNPRKLFLWQMRIQKPPHRV